MGKEYGNEVVTLLQKLIRAKSYSGQEKPAADCLKDYFAANGYDEIAVDRYGSIYGVINGNRPGPTVLFDGHIDTVPVSDETKWKYPPFEGRLENGRVYGRGASDMKGAVAAAAVAAAEFARETGKDFAGRIAVDGVVHEECFEGVASREISKNLKPDYVVIGEASNLNLKIGQRGRAEIVIETYGVPAHSANPEKGVNAVTAMAKVVAGLETLEPPRHDKLGQGIMVVTDIISSPYPGASVIPELCRVTIDRRLLPGEKMDGVLAPIEELLKRLSAEDPDFKARTFYAKGKEDCYTGSVIEAERFFPGWIYDEKEDYIQAIYREMKAAGMDPEISHYNFCTNASHYAGEAGIKTIGLGPSAENLAHTIDEYIELDQLTRAAEAYRALMRALLL